VVPDRELALVPFTTLPLEAPERDGWPVFLGERHETAFLPLAWRPAEDEPARLPVLLAGDPIPGSESAFPRLLRADEELRRLGAVWPSPHTMSLRGDDLTATALGAGSLARYRTIHLATHAVASSLDPSGCALILSRGERLGLDALSRLSLGPALVILSACRTGEGEVVPGEGLIGLGRAFLAAGARAVVVSLWSVEDRAAADTMVSFHRHLREGADPVQGLARACREAAARGDHPAYWAPFTVLLSPEPVR
jgi:CHAT domain-containing protein